MFLVGVFAIGCARGPAARTITTSQTRLAWLQSEVARGDFELMRGAYVPRQTPGAAIVCSLAIQIDAWYGVGDERWELTHAQTSMLPARNTRNIREELARIGIRDCVLDTNR